MPKNVIIFAIYQQIIRMIYQGGMPFEIDQK